ncbi:Bacteriocin-protection, YdeI or OmpD-Associated [Granulicella rosea]|uniref:Bacteriocin-protection, YdeI or OmpD-Associated n=1 Tax=Granulicella rosea TaxID=474952 RepID=A0A239GVW0_9BACT|nr:YdeI/OmpD-associated family protein [Granulicella rosea]SNS73005.1 Bacteriocin-protection, YdeI or OmpD-Associated [Granulicella rosea]
MAKPANPIQHFTATLEKGDRALGWTIARVPFDPAVVWKEMIRLRISGEVNGFAFRTSLFPDPRGGFYLLVNHKLQQGAGIRLGSSAEFHLQPDLEPREAELPDELAVLLDEEEGLRDWYDALSEYTRREIGKWVLGVKSDAARIGRAEQMAERLLATMDAERELPPLIAQAFAARPKAKAGWSRMTGIQRKNELMAVFYYRTPESRQKRLEKMLDAAERR